MSEHIKKPPIGLIPKYIWEQERLGEICSAIIRYYNEGLQIPIAWIEEYNELVIKNKEMITKLFKYWRKSKEQKAAKLAAKLIKVLDDMG